MNEYDNIRLFKKNRNTGGPEQESTNADLKNRDERIPEKRITPFEVKDYSRKVNPSPRDESFLPPGLTAILRKSLKALGIDLNQNFSLQKAGELVKKSPLWSLLKKL
ncbi:hypothetical protein Desor_3550 [Desulfosporosinus orientis DSM 765]|uniref:Uncharacterized protein n=1 Tax=Desulfosporosinus orientis (strain ATCC 19365 / DSM 765 / NCIMB 8382 / VKM B-1628 / Singapore I) TaxID=768706 RepID=G7WIF8_DESOD|nr:hypothetical protein [Desulfosporosinus orientis]AET69032.1 hypothetical protein Desor_3550 [Desulfosporosinus orientis DSM 765]